LCTGPQHLRALQLKAGSPPIVFTYLGQPLENLQLGPSGSESKVLADKEEGVKLLWTLDSAST